MLRKTMILFPAALLGVISFAASAETLDRSEIDMFRSASVSIQQAGEAALQAQPGTLASVFFGDENGRAAYEAIVIGADGQPWTVLIDSKNGEVIASALSSTMNDDEEGVRGDDDQDGVRGEDDQDGAGGEDRDGDAQHDGEADDD